MLLKIISLFAVILSSSILLLIIIMLAKQAISVFSHHYLIISDQQKNYSLDNIITENFAIDQVEEIKIFKNQVISQQEHHDISEKKFLLLTSTADSFLKNTTQQSMLYLSDFAKEKLLFAKQNKQIISKFHLEFFQNSDSQEGEIAGIFSSLIGSSFTILLTILFAIPIATMTAFYLEEYAPSNWFTYLIEININNLASIPSIIYGLIGLSFYINFLDLPRSSSLVAALTLGLMILPTMIISTRQSLQAIPISLRQGIIALGVSKMQMIKDHLLPLSIPGIATGTILSILRAIGETAPLLMIGMVSFIATAPKDILSPATVLPIQIYLWTKNIEPEYIGKTAAAILLLIVILIFLNIITILVHKKFTKKLY